MDFSQERRIARVGLGDDVRSEIGNASEFGGQIDVRFPMRDGIGDFRPDPLDAPQFVRLGQQDALGRLKNVQQTAQSHRPQLGDHVQRDTCLGFGHGGNAITDVKG